jgi:hypothetical protein
MEMTEFEALSGKVLAGEGEPEERARLQRVLAENPHYRVRYKEISEAWEVVRQGGRFAPVKSLPTPPFPQHRMAELIATVRATRSPEAMPQPSSIHKTTAPKKPDCAWFQEIIEVLPLEVQELVRRWTDGTPSPRGTSFSKDDLLSLFSSSAVFGAAPVPTPASRSYWPPFGATALGALPFGFLHALFGGSANIRVLGRSRSIHTVYNQGRALVFVNDEESALMLVDRESKIIYFLRREKGGGIKAASIPPSLSDVERKQRLEKELDKIQ